MKTSPLPHPIFRHKIKRQEHGATLIEVLIAALILSIGLLGLAGLQAATVRYKLNSWARTGVADLVADLSDKIRMNPNVAGSDFGTGLAVASLYTYNDTWANQQNAALTLPATNCDTTTCSDVDRAAFDLMSWRIKVRNQLPQGAALLGGDKLSGVQVTLMWFDKNFTTQGTNLASAMQTSGACTGAETGAAALNCCPPAAAVPAGVRCQRFLIYP